MREEKRGQEEMDVLIERTWRRMFKLWLDVMSGDTAGERQERI